VKKRVLALVLSVLLCLSLLPAVAFAADGDATVDITSSSSGNEATASATISAGGILTINLKNGSQYNSKTFETTIDDENVAQIESGESLSLGSSATGVITVLGLSAGEAVITSTGTGGSGGSTYTATINLTVTGELGDSQTITYNANGGTGTMDDTSGIEGASVTLRANAFSNPGYFFAGWNTKADGTGTAYKNKDKITMPAGGLNLYAQWTAAGSTTYQLADSIEDGETYLIVARTGSSSNYTYYAMTNAAENSIYLADELVTVDGDYVTSQVDESMLWTFTAVTSSTYNVKNGDDFLVRISYNDGGGIKTGADTGTGYTDWAYDGSSHEFTVYSINGSVDFYLSLSTSGTQYFDCTQTSSGTIYLYKQIGNASSSHTVTFNANNGTGTMGAQTASASTALTANAFTRPGFKFTGWNTAANGGGDAYADGTLYSFAADTTLYAQWAAYGDVDGDGDVTDADRTKLARFLAGWSGYEISESVSDVNDDGEVTDADRTILARHLAGWIGYDVLPYIA